MLCFDDDFEFVDNEFLKFYLRVIYLSVDDNSSKSLQTLYFTSEFFRLLFFLHRTLSTLISVLLDLLTFTRSLSLLPPPLSLSLCLSGSLSLSFLSLYHLSILQSHWIIQISLIFWERSCAQKYVSRTASLSPYSSTGTKSLCHLCCRAVWKQDQLLWL